MGTILREGKRKRKAESERGKTQRHSVTETARAS